MSDIIAETITHHGPWELRTTWMAFKLSDGSSDKVLYDTKADAIRHQLHEQLCCYVAMGNVVAGMSPMDCQIFINLHRHLYANGGRIQDAEHPRSLILSTRSYEIMRGERPKPVA
jgi:hypothetical protein